MNKSDSVISAMGIPFAKRIYKVKTLLPVLAAESAIIIIIFVLSAGKQEFEF